jgi:hypothetical protein
VQTLIEECLIRKRETTSFSLGYLYSAGAKYPVWNGDELDNMGSTPGRRTMMEKKQVETASLKMTISDLPSP